MSGLNYDTSNNSIPIITSLFQNNYHDLSSRTLNQIEYHPLLYRSTALLGGFLGTAYLVLLLNVSKS